MSKRRCRSTESSVWTTWPPLSSSWSNMKRRWAPAGTFWPWSRTMSKPCSGRERWGWRLLPYYTQTACVSGSLSGPGRRFLDVVLVWDLSVLCSAVSFGAFSVCSRLLISQLLSDKGEYKEAMEVLKKALKLEPTTKVRLCGGVGALFIYSKSTHQSFKQTPTKGESTLRPRSL